MKHLLPDHRRPASPRNIYRLLLALLTLQCSSPLTVHAVEDPELRKILQKHVEAMGGWKNLNAIESIRLNGTIERNGRVMDLCIIKKRPNQIRATVTVPIPGKEDEFMQVIRAHDGDHAWTATRLAGERKLKRNNLTDKQADDLLKDASLYPKLIQLWNSGARITLLSQSHRPHAHINIEVQPKDSSERYIFKLDRETALTQEFLQIQKDGSTRLTKLSNFQSIKGIQLPIESLISEEGSSTTTIRTHSVRTGVGIYEEYFAQFGD